VSPNVQRRAQRSTVTFRSTLRLSRLGVGGLHSNSDVPDNRSTAVILLSALILMACTNRKHAYNSTWLERTYTIPSIIRAEIHVSLRQYVMRFTLHSSVYWHILAGKFSFRCPRIKTWQME